LGFEQEIFHPELHNMKLPDCGGPFRGTCDADVARWIGDQLAADPGHRHFFYWLTLNSHLPVEADPDASKALGCGTAASPVKDEATCNLLALVARAERAVSNLAMRPDLPKTEFILVGDHAPPFIFKQRRDKFSQHQVPYIHLTPRQ
jgi:phosphoglycerol transferase MdoB-like AlkP superfamily enzyme